MPILKHPDFPASATDETLSLTWTAATDFIGVVGYNIYKDGRKVNEAPVQETAITIYGMQSAVTYVLKLEALDAAGNTSAAAKLSVTTPHIKAPSAPMELRADKTTEHQVVLSWQAATDNVGVVGYHVYLDGVLLSTTLFTSNSYVTERPFGKDVYKFTVKAVDAAGNLSLASNSALVDNGIIKNETADISWKKDYFEFAPDGFAVYPNPSQGNLKLIVNNNQNGTITITMYNASGVLIRYIKDVKNGAYQK